MHVHEVELLAARRRRAHRPRREQRGVIGANLSPLGAVPFLGAHRVAERAGFARGVLVQGAERVGVGVHELRQPRAPNLRGHPREVPRERVPPRLAHERAGEERIVVEPAEDELEDGDREVLEADAGGRRGGGRGRCIVVAVVVDHRRRPRLALALGRHGE